MQKKTVALLGAGALARIFVENFDRLLGEHYEFAGLYTRTAERGEALLADTDATVYASLENLITDAPDIVVEFAGGAALKALASPIVEAGIDLVVVSTGALADEAFKQDLLAHAQKTGSVIHVASGAIGGLDLMQTLSAMGLTEVSIMSTKAPKSLNGAPGLAGRELSLEHDEMAFEGGMIEAIAGFPKNVNVAVTTGLATDFADLTVKIKSEPHATENRHVIDMKGDLVRAHLEIASQPDPRNPKSSTSTAFSVLALLKNLASPLRYF